MIYKLKKLFDLYDLIEKLGDKTFDVEIQYKFVQLYDVILENLKKIDDLKLQILTTYAKKDENGEMIIVDNTIQIEESSRESCLQEIDKLENSTISLPDIYFTLTELGALNLTLKELMLLTPFVKD